MVDILDRLVCLVLLVPLAVLREASADLLDLNSLMREWHW